MGQVGERVVEWMRGVLLGDLDAVVARLEREVAEQARALRDLEIVRPLVLAVLQEHMATAEADRDAAITLAVESVLRRRAAQQPTVRRWRGATRGLVAVAAIALTLSIAVRKPDAEGGGATVADLAAEAHLPAPVALAPVVAEAAAAEPPVPALVLDERQEGFGLGDAALSDDELGRRVRTQLSACRELTDAEVSFSVKDGWVWLRGAASASGREAAERALDGLAPGVLVVNQLAVRATDGGAVAAR